MFQTNGQEDDKKEEEERHRECVSVDVGNTQKPPHISHHLVEPTYLELGMETVHPLQTKPLQLRSFLCGKIKCGRLIFQPIA